MTFRDLHLRHAGADVWVCGCGPSLDRAVELGIPAAAVVVCVNRAVELVPHGCRYFVAQDPETYHRWRGAPRGCVSLVPRGYLEIWDREQPDIANDVRARSGRDVVLCSYESPAEIPTDRSRVARDELLYTCVGSATPGAFLAWYLGAARVVLAGIDGGQGHSRAALERAYSSADVADRRTTPYDELRASATRVLRVLGVPYVHVTELEVARCGT